MHSKAMTPWGQFMERMRQEFLHHAPTGEWRHRRRARLIVADKQPGAVPAVNGARDPGPPVLSESPRDLQRTAQTTGPPDTTDPDQLANVPCWTRNSSAPDDIKAPAWPAARPV
jgi:hypothetical protein